MKTHPFRIAPFYARTRWYFRRFKKKKKGTFCKTAMEMYFFTLTGHMAPNKESHDILKTWRLSVENSSYVAATRWKLVCLSSIAPIMQCSCCNGNNPEKRKFYRHSSSNDLTQKCHFIIVFINIEMEPGSSFIVCSGDQLPL